MWRVTYTCVQAHGKAIVSDTERDKQMVADMLALKRRVDAQVINCFDNDERFAQCVKDAFDVFINQRANKPGEMIGM